MKLLFLDLETTDLDVENNKIIQCAYKVVSGEKEKIVNEYYSNESRRIDLEAKVAHGIRESDLENKSTFKGSDQYNDLQRFCSKLIVVTHNGSKYDNLILNREGIDIPMYIDTLKVAKYYLWEIQEEFNHSYKLELLRYYLEEKENIRIEARAHDAS